MKWFKHDTNASVDAKLERVTMKYGMEGYGLYWYCLEMIAKSVEKHNLTFELEHDAEVIAHRTGIHYEKVEEMMTYMVNLRLFEASDGVITCLKMRTRTDEYTQKLLSALKSVPTLSRQSHDAVGIKSVLIEENRIEEKRIEEKKTSRFAPPSLEEVTTYCKQRHNDVDPEKFIDHYEANGWFRGKTKIKDWKACVRTWEKSNGNSTQSIGDIYARA